jgi:hypothetical protein
MMRDLLNHCRMKPPHEDIFVVRCFESARVSAKLFAARYRIGRSKTDTNDLNNGHAKKQTFV